MGNEIGCRLVPFARHAEFIVDHTLIKKPLLKFAFFPFLFFLHVQICEVNDSRVSIRCWAVFC